MWDLLKGKRRMTSAQVIMFGFAGLILAGTLFLMLPFATKEAGSARFSDALFTATSAVCVTGLVVRDTAFYWSEFGQAVILLMIQIGGLGVVTMAAAVTIASGKKISLKQRSTMQEAISAHHVGGIVRLTGFILKATFTAELLGAVLLAPAFVRDFGWGRGLWMAVFHSISAFCNAGFDLMGIRSPFSSLTSYAARPLVNAVVMALIVTGGIGFLTWQDIRTNGVHLRRYRLQSKMILSVSGVLILLPAVYFFFFEFSALPLGERICCSLFQAVTPRTAGFNTADLNALSQTGQALTMVLMLIGGSPGSTAGGMKTTTVAVLLVCAVSVFRRRENLNAFGRRIADETVKNASTILMMYLALFFTGGLIISSVEKLPLGTCLFETASAIGTVGLTLGITPELGMVSRFILIGLMFFGRVGGLTLIFATLSGSQQYYSKLPLEKITVG